MHAAVPQVRESGQSINGIRLSARARITTGRMTRILRLLALTPSKFNTWSGFTLPQYVKENPTMTERQASVMEGPPGFFELVQENYEAIDRGGAA